MKKRIGILTGGGDCPGLNAVVRASVKSALGLGWDVIGFKDGYEGLVEDKILRLTDIEVSGIIARGGTLLGTSNTANPFAYIEPPLGTPQKPVDVSQTAKN
ncbi:MAG: 6-phosphofructokinase, partial [Elusimicrobia bacterium]|nr:6-phosphofructokinase [Elusimicrobiota bacterium]